MKLNYLQKEASDTKRVSLHKKLRGFDFILELIDVLNLACVTGPFAFTWYIFYSQSVYLEPFYRRGNWIIVMLFVFLYFIYGRTYDAFSVSTSSISEMIYSQGLAVFMADFILYFVMWVLLRQTPDIIPLTGCFVIQLMLAALWCLLMHKWYFHVFGGKVTAVVYDKDAVGNQLIGAYGGQVQICV